MTSSYTLGTMPKASEYEAALRELEGLRAAGRIDQVTYDLHRSKLLAEAGSGPRWTVWNIVGVVIVVVMLALVVRALVF